MLATAASLALAALAAAPLAAAADVGVWTSAGSSGVVCIHTALLPGMRLLCTERPHTHTSYPANANTNGELSADIDLLNGADINGFGTWTSKFTARHVDTNPFCGGHAQMANGSIFHVGGDPFGNLGPNPTTDGIYADGRQGRRIYNPCPAGSAADCVGSWTTLPSMTSQRWYPTVATLADGSNIIIGGTTVNLDLSKLNASENNPTYEYWPAKTGDWPRQLDILSWAYPYMLYPMVFVLPSEKVFLFVSNKTVIIDPKTDQLSFTVPDLPVIDHAPWIYPYTPTMTILPMTQANNYKFTLQVCGGSKQTTADASPMCWQISPEDANPTWTRVDDMPNARVMVDSAILPDGTILYVNGAGGGLAGGDAGDVLNAYNPVMIADLFDPTAATGKQWTSLAAATNYRLYHSGVVLLESGHVVTTGSEMNNYDDFHKNKKSDCKPYVKQFNADCTSPFNTNIERFTPPYLQRAERNGRPVISKAPTTLTHKSTFIVELSSSISNVARATFIRYTTTTHQTNTDQRFIELKILYSTSNSLVLQAPDTAGRAPPGNWMLFILDKDGVPSVAKTIQLQLGDAVTAAVPSGATPFTAPTGSGSGSNTGSQKGSAVQTAISSVAGALSAAAAFALPFLF
ncbi:hypothetical protein HK105_206953 [Polyrhizophydium stewartii]|uniref:Glyoxal oxidase n=1 Tax=Polyrhizophydium stewartii TaxID=2732419 RepID=A0ABR4N1T5_9FUNG